MDEVGFFDTYTRSDFANNDASGVWFFAIDANYYTLKSLRTKFVTFFDFLGDTNSITGANIDYGFLFLCVTNFF